MNKEIIEKYLDKKVVLNLKTNYTYRGKIVKLYDDSLEFEDILGNNLVVSFDGINLIMIDREIKK